VERGRSDWGDLFNFVAYDYGPFDRRVYDVRDRLTQDGFLEVIPGRYDSYRLSQQGQERVKEISRELGEDADWVRRSQTQFTPLRVGRLWIGASWHTPPLDAAYILRIDPGLAFGTGSHPSTRLVLGFVERVMRGGERVLDYGCGSGILAIAALKLGARRAVGVDIDTNAVATARDNARRNGVAGEFLGVGAPLTFIADVVIANILANPLMVLAPVLASRCRQGGRIALSGILSEQASEVAKCYLPWIAFAPPAEAEGWVCLSGVRL